MKPVWTVEHLTSSAKKHLLIIKFGVLVNYGIQTPRISWNKLELNITHTALAARPLSPLIEPLVFLAVIDRYTSARLEIVTDHCYRSHIYSTYQLLLHSYISFRKVFCASYKEMRDG